MTDWLSSAEPSDPPEDDYDPFASVACAIGILAEKLRHSPQFSKSDAALLIKTLMPECSIFFRTMIWPSARRIAGLPQQPRGRPPKKDVFIDPR